MGCHSQCSGCKGCGLAQRASAANRIGDCGAVPSGSVAVVTCLVEDWSQKPERQLNEIAVSDRGTLRALSDFPSRPFSCGASNDSMQMRLKNGSEIDGVCDNLCMAACKLLILKPERCPSG